MTLRKIYAIIAIKKLFCKVLPKIANKLVLVLAISTPMTDTSKKMILERVPYIYYLVWFRKNKVKAPINFGNSVNTILQKYTSKLCLKICYTNVKTPKIYDSNFKIFRIVLASFEIEDKLVWIWFFKNLFY